MLVLAASFILVLRDLVVGGLGSSNSKAVSFIESIASCTDYRRQKPQSPRTPVRVMARQVSASARAHVFNAPADAHTAFSAFVVLFACLWVKFGSATIGSLLLGETPVLLKGPRHILTFGAALAVVQLSPADCVYHAIQRRPPAQLLLRLCAAIYKVRPLPGARLPGARRRF